MQLASFIYIKRCWFFDKTTFSNAITYFHELTYKYTLLVFPEGTDLTKSTRINSNNYAERHNLQVRLVTSQWREIQKCTFQEYEHVLHPRTTGFTYMTGELLQRNALDAVYDVTLVYPDVVPQTERMLLRGLFPKQVKVHLARYVSDVMVRVIVYNNCRYPTAVLPRSEEGLKYFLEERWREKEKIITEFFATGQFLHGQILRRNKPWELYSALIFWTVLPYVVLYLFLTISWFKHLVIAHSFVLLIVNLTCNGFPKFEAGVYRWKRLLFGRGF